MQQHLVDVEWPWCDKIHVRMDFSDELRSVGRPSGTKVLRLLRLITRCWRERLRGPIDVLYYPPSGSSWTGLLRDLVFLCTVRPLVRTTIFHFHAGGFDASLSRLPRVLSPLASLAFHGPDLAIVLTRSLADEVEPIAPKRVEVVPNGIRSRPRPTQAMPVHHEEPSDSPLRLLYVGTMSRAKGIGVLTRVVANLAKTGVSLRLDLVGGFDDDRFESEVREMIERDGLSARIRLLGPRSGEEKWERFFDADVFCFPTHYPRENQPVAVIEAMMVGLPILATRWRAVPEMVRHQVEGLLVPTEDESAIGDAISLLNDSPELRRTYGAAARLRFEETYTIARHLARIEACTQEVIDQ